MLSLKGKIAIVMGCGSSGPGWGNGKAIAVLFARQGARVIGTDRNAEAAEETRRLIAEEGGACEVHVCDATDNAAVGAFIRGVDEAHGAVDILVNNVGQSEPGGPVDMSEEVWAAQFQLNATTAFLACKHVIPIMQKQGSGAIVSVSSVAGQRYIGKPQVGYAAAKAALIQFTKTSAVIHAGENIRMNCVVPGLMHTPLVNRLAERYAGGDYEGFVAKRHGQVPMGHMGDAWDVAHAALFLASDEARYVTGTEIVVDGGITAATR
ncbi:SDR family NAD(P)-dependent oxidoreductase [Enterovirga rhinocerotis]|uniref:NAD(P)-dependent dehydrogenase (Short-subunit alcohol dehydrogenase family) n=1 Tax=Enterovirga rhinocerotis TaxID=1339210 RepID=A0A4R7C974_9HYPH|nr:SDR family NAD(P)-dependent oxidoreductase [Enterovirga rhinocerotis]TDR94998.1 NAD(P)-dependent dehydrogenase (short-subunit alcohol dehydrogenase family) [Enterovirga rhinocerotis]